MSKSAQGGSTRLGRDSRSKRLGVKLSDGQPVSPGMVIIRQRGSKYLIGENVKRGGDDTIFAMIPGKVKFKKVLKTCFDGRKRRVSQVSVVK